jgi:hypothetical protein
VGADAVAKAIIPGYNGSLSADAQAIANAMQAAIAWITTNVPEDANGYVLVYKWQADGTQTARTFSTSPNQWPGCCAHGCRPNNRLGQ